MQNPNPLLNLCGDLHMVAFRSLCLLHDHAPTARTTWESASRTVPGLSEAARQLCDDRDRPMWDTIAFIRSTRIGCIGLARRTAILSDAPAQETRLREALDDVLSALRRIWMQQMGLAGANDDAERRKLDAALAAIADVEYLLRDVAKTEGGEHPTQAPPLHLVADALALYSATTKAVEARKVTVLPIFLGPGVEPGPRAIRLAQTRTAYLEAHGNVTAGLKALKSAGTKIGRSTFYEHLAVLDKEHPGWRAHMLVSGPSGNPENLVTIRIREKRRATPG